MSVLDFDGGGGVLTDLSRKIVTIGSSFIYSACRILFVEEVWDILICPNG